MICTYGFWAGYQIMMNICEEKRIFEAVFETSNGERHEATYGIVYQWLS